MQRVLVTGGGGFIGSHLCETLLKDNSISQVICLDNWSTGRMINVQDFKKDPRFKIIDHDIIEPIDLTVEAIYNLACPASPDRYQVDPVKTTMTCVVGTANLLNLARKNGASFLQASTSEVYGDPLQHPQAESYFGNVSSIGPRACYDEGKRCAESLVSDFRRTYGLNTKIARIFNTYGPRMARDDGRVVSNFIVQALDGQPITIFGDGTQTRSFCYVSDLVSGLIVLMNSAPRISGPINLGNPTEYTVGQLAELVAELAQTAFEIVNLPLPTDDPKRRKPDIALAFEQLGWAPTVDIRSGLKLTLSHFLEERDTINRKIKESV